MGFRGENPRVLGSTRVLPNRRPGPRHFTQHADTSNECRAKSSELDTFHGTCNVASQTTIPRQFSSRHERSPAVHRVLEVQILISHGHCSILQCSSSDTGQEASVCCTENVQTWVVTASSGSRQTSLRHSGSACTVRVSHWVSRCICICPACTCQGLEFSLSQRNARICPRPEENS